VDGGGRTTSPSRRLSSDYRADRPRPSPVPRGSMGPPGLAVEAWGGRDGMGRDGMGLGVGGGAGSDARARLAYLLSLLLLALDGALELRDDALGPHADVEALLEPALLALAPHVHVDLAVVAVLALVHRVLGDAAPEEALAALASEGVVVVAGGPVPAYEAELLLLSRSRALFLLGVAAVGAVAIEGTRRRQVVPS
jgi:hypothetical protein